VGKRSIPISTLEPFERGQRNITAEALEGLKESIRESTRRIPGWKPTRGYRLETTITVNKNGNRVIGGHQRLRALEEMGQDWVHPDDVTWIDVPPGSAEEALHVINLNNEMIQGRWAKPALGIIEEIQHEIPDLSAGLRFQELRLEIEQLFPDLVVSDPALDEAPAPPKKPISKPGTLWQLGDHRVLCGSSTDAAAIARLMGKTRARWMWTDPPYGVDYVGGTKDALTIEGDTAEGLPALLLDAFHAADQVLIAGAPIYVAHPDGVQSVEFAKAFLDVGWLFHERLVWVKDQFVLGHMDYHCRHESILYGWKKGRKRPWLGGRTQDTIFEVPKPARNPDHPTMKPVELIERMLVNSSRRGDVGLEPFGGSGSTLIAAEKLERRCRAMELDPRYCDVIVERWQTLTGRKARRRGS